LAVVAIFLIVSMSLLVAYNRLSNDTQTAVAEENIRRLLAEFVEHKNDPVTKNDLDKALEDAEYSDYEIKLFSRTESEELTDLVIYRIEFSRVNSLGGDDLYVSKYEP